MLAPAAAAMPAPIAAPPLSVPAPASPPFSAPRTLARLTSAPRQLMRAESEASSSGGGDSSSDNDAAYHEMLQRVRVEQEQLGQLVLHPF